MATYLQNERTMREIALCFRSFPAKQPRFWPQVISRRDKASERPSRARRPDPTQTIQSRNNGRSSASCSHIATCDGRDQSLTCRAIRTSLESGSKGVQEPDVQALLFPVRGSNLSPRGSGPVSSKAIRRGRFPNGLNNNHFRRVVLSAVSSSVAFPPLFSFISTLISRRRFLSTSYIH